MAAKATSLLATSFLLNAVQILEQLQEVSVDVDNTLVDGRGLADRYVQKQATKQAQKVELKAHWYNASTTQEATTLDVTLYSIGGSDQKGQMKSGSVEISNNGPETSAMVDPVEYLQATSTEIVVSSDIMIVTEGVFTNTQLSASITTGIRVAVSITLPGETLTISAMILKSTKHSTVRGEVQMENVTLELAKGAVVSSPTDGSILALAATGTALAPFTWDSGVNEYVVGSGQTFVLSRMGLRFADKQLIEQNITLSAQGGMAITEGA